MCVFFGVRPCTYLIKGDRGVTSRASERDFSVKSRVGELFRA